MDNKQNNADSLQQSNGAKTKRKGIIPSEQTRKNISAGLINHKLPVIIEGIHYESLVAAARALGMYSTKISSRVRSRQSRWAAWTWAPKNNETN
jgi:hypothetical protein